MNQLNGRDFFWFDEPAVISFSGIENWWAGMEDLAGGTFRKDEPSYRELGIIARSQETFDFDVDDNISCFCGD